MRKYLIMMFLCFLCFSLIFPELSVSAYTDMSTFKIETGNFETKTIAQTSLNSLIDKTGLSGTIQATEDYQNYYQVFSGGFIGEDRVKKVLGDFKTSTGINAGYEGVGEPEKYYQVYSGGFRGESQVKTVLQDFKKSTGLNAGYFGVGELEPYYQLISGGFVNEDRVKAISQDFKKSTGINATYEGMGTPKNQYELISGAFIGEERVKKVLNDLKTSTGISGTYEGVGDKQNYYVIITGAFRGESRVIDVLNKFKKATGFNASYIDAGNNSYRIKTEPILEGTNLSKAKNFFTSNGWWFTSNATSQQGYERFRIKAAVLGFDLANKGKTFFVKNGWYVMVHQTGKVGYERFHMISDPILGNDSLKTAKNFFTKNNWYVSTKTTGKSGYEVYKIKTDPLLGMDLVKKAKGFFEKHNWHVNTQDTGQTGYSSFRIRTESVLGLDLVNKARQFFLKNNWYVAYSATGDTSPYYKIVTDEILGYDKALTDINMIENQFGWNATAIKTKNGPQLMYTDYGLSFSSMLDKEMALNPQTDKYRNDPRYVNAAYVDMDKQIITADHVNVRTVASINSTPTQQLNTGDYVIVIGKTGDWVEIRLTWQNAQESDVNDYLNPNNFSIDSKDYFQFLKLSHPANLDANEVNQKILYNKGILAGKAQYYIDAANQYGVNEVYLLSHSILETGNGTSPLSTGVQYNGKTVYNMYGYGAFDSCPVTCGAQKAYDNGWFTPEAAILGGAKLISQDYIYHDTFQQDTLYKMRWNPVQTWHQYATDIGWAYKQINSIYSIYQLLDNYTLYFDVPSYQ